MAAAGMAVLLALGSALCVAIGDVLQQQAAHRADGSVPGARALLGSPRWALGALLLVVSIALQAAALGRGSVLLVQALLVLSLLFALPVNAVLLRRTVTGRQWAWATVLTVAVTVIVTVGNPQAGHARAALPAWAAALAVLGPLLIGCLVVAHRRGGALAAALLAFVSGTLWAVFAVLTKGVVDLIGHGPAAVLGAPEFYAWLAAGVAGFAWEQSAFRAGSLTASMPTLEVTQPIVAAALGVAVLGETLRTGAAGAVALAAAVVAMTLATVELARGDAADPRVPDADPDVDPDRPVPVRVAG